MLPCLLHSPCYYGNVGTYAGGSDCSPRRALRQLRVPTFYCKLSHVPYSKFFGIAAPRSQLNTQYNKGPTDIAPTVEGAIKGPHVGQPPRNRGPTVARKRSPPGASVQPQSAHSRLFGLAKVGYHTRRRHRGAWALAPGPGLKRVRQSPRCPAAGGPAVRRYSSQKRK